MNIENILKILSQGDLHVRVRTRISDSIGAVTTGIRFLWWAIYVTMSPNADREMMGSVCISRPTRVLTEF